MRYDIDLVLSSLGSQAVTAFKMCEEHIVATLLMAHARCRPIGLTLQRVLIKRKKDEEVFDAIDN